MSQNILRLFLMLQQWKWKYASSAILMIFSFILLSLEPRILQFAVDGILAFYKNGDNSALNADVISRAFSSLLPDMGQSSPALLLILLAGIYIVISLSRGGLELIAFAQSADATEGALKKLRDDLFEHVQKLPMDFFNQMSRGELIQRSTGDVVTVGNFLSTQVIEVVRLSAIFGFSFLMMLVIDWKYALLAICLAPLNFLMSLIFFSKERVVWEKHEEESDKLNARIQENLNGIRVVKALSNESGESEKFDHQNKAKLSVALKHVYLHATFWPISDFLIGMQMVIVVLFGGYFAYIGQISIGELISFHAYAMLTTWPMRHIGQTLSQMGMAIVAMERLHHILSSPIEKLEGLSPAAEIKGEIEFRDVTFSYHPGVLPNVLNQMSFKIEPGESVALVGPTGSGKSTIIHLLSGLYQPQSGQILLDGKPLDDFSKEYLHQQIGVVLQTPFMFSNSIRENIAYGIENPQSDAVSKVIEMAQASRLGDILEDGFETTVGEKGVTLSGGQKQRVALARTLLMNTPVLVLDDVTSAVDTATERAIFEGLADFISQRTTVLISHRITSLQPASRLLVLENGKIVQEGKPEELQQSPGYYKQIHQMQVSLENEILSETHRPNNGNLTGMRKDVT